MLGSAIATCISDIPFDGPCATTQIGMIDGEFIVNPTNAQKKVSDMALTVASTREKVIMIEAGAKEVPENIMIDAIFKAHEVNQEIIKFIDTIVAECGKPKHSYESCAVPEELFAAIRELVPQEEMEEAVFTDEKQKREENIRAITERLEEAFADNEEWLAVLGEAVYQYQKKTVRKMILERSQASGWPRYHRDPSAGSRDRYSAACTRFRYVHPWTDTDFKYLYTGSAVRGTEDRRTG